MRCAPQAREMQPWVRYLVLVNGVYDVLCALSLFLDGPSPLAAMFEPILTEHERVLLAYFTLLFGLRRLLEAQVPLSYVAETAFFLHLACVGRVSRWRAAMVAAGSLLLAAASAVYE